MMISFLISVTEEALAVRGQQNSNAVKARGFRVTTSEGKITAMNKGVHRR